ncbi:tetraspanin-18-like [Crassostrea angulata]|uniref:tetraspanin-18-like n=1 Tax=Magallana angulata TaxID=2784310 RepID=UPI0022B14B6F|nr:tetraspanin-18-like [Crassostrea angulata]
MAQGGCSKFGKVFLVIINLVFLVLGLGLLIAGVLVKINALSSDVTPALNSVEVAGYKLGDLANNLSIVFIVIGAFIVLVSGLGLIGGCCEVRWMLVVYAILVLILLIMKIAAVALWFKMRTDFEETVKEELFKSLNDEYENDFLNSTNPISNAWNYAFLTFDCCGVNPVMNKTDNDFTATPWCTKDPGTCYQMGGTMIPRSCCTGVDQSNYIANANPECYRDVKGKYNEMGCYDAVKDLISTYGNVFIAISIVVMVVEVFAVLFAIIICRQAGSD